MVDPSPDRNTQGRSDATPVAGPAALRNDPLPLPKFILRQTDGLYVALPFLDSPTLLSDFVESLFNSCLRFADLDYACLQKLLYESSRVDIITLAQDLEKRGKAPMLRLASDIVPFPPARALCYRDAKLIESGAAAEYLFEPVFIDTVIEEPVYGDAGPDGSAPIIDHLQKTVSERTRLDLDEFIAAMWSKGVRYGIDTAAVARAIAGDLSERVIIARMRAPTPGRDASVAELASGLHRDNTPKLLPDGRVDLHQFQNRFPQVAQDVRLIRKVPRVLGTSGRDIAGHELAAELPRDIDINLLAGLGTRVDRTAEGEFVVANLGGFLQIDTASSSLSISDKIVNREGVHLRTTGNLTLSCDEYEEHGEVEEHTQIEGKHMVFMANVFGSIVSRGGRVALKKNMMAGSIKAAGGTITVEGNASRATLEAIDGEITLHFAESCLIVGKKVTVGRVVHCDILAQELTVESAEGSTLAAQRMQVGTAGARRDVATTISMLIPDLSAFTKQLDELKRKQLDAMGAMATASSEIAAITSQPDVKNYSILSAKLRAKELNMTPEQAANLQKLMTRVAPALRQLKALNNDLQAARIANDEAARKIQDLTQECERKSAGITCNVTAITGETLIRTLKLHPGAVPLHMLAPRELRARMCESNPASEILFSGSDGEFAWTFLKQDDAESQLADANGPS